MSNIIQNGASTTVNLQTGEKLAVSSIDGTFSAVILAGVGVGTALATNSIGGEYGPYVSPVVIQVSSSADGLVDFEVGTVPSLDYREPVTAVSNPLTGGISLLAVGGRDIVADLGIKGTIQSGLRQFSTRCYLPEQQNGSLKQIMCRSQHTARSSVTSLQIAYPAWYVAGGTVETAQGSASTIRASIEYPVGTFTQVMFSGAASGSIASGATLLSDSVSVSIPNGAVFFVRSWCNNASGVVYNGVYKGLPSEGSAFGVTTPDLTMGGAVAASTTVCYGPCAIVSNVAGRSIGIIGDSIGAGSTDTANNGDVGLVARSVGQVSPYFNTSIPSASIATFISSGAKRLALLQAYATDVVIQLGTNDVPSGVAATILANLQTVIGYFPSKRVFVCTISPRSTSSDSWVTTANQTVTADEATRITLNQNIRSVISGSDGTFDTANVLESSRNSGKWDVSLGESVVSTTADGLHPNLGGFMKVKHSGAINPALFI